MARRLSTPKPRGNDDNDKKKTLFGIYYAEYCVEFITQIYYLN